MSATRELEFARNTKTGRVHILHDGPERDWVPLTRECAGPAAEVLSMLTEPLRMLCGARMLVGAFDNYPAVWVAGDSFADADLCIACVRALGDQQWCAFHVDNRGQ